MKQRIFNRTKSSQRYEKPFEEHLRNETAHRVHSLKQRIIDDLWEMNNNGTPYPIWVERAQIA
ncbi:unnamed protein product [Nippostrongylus brasiliensis]|uniref:Transposase n=1 Tax=Nippostrongylus brasiliensis TaxID=27835 RepID=A0A0N4Y003_NIPBR|nr:unnamed protein product [Nippostrongylus brasiliensis]